MDNKRETICQGQKGTKDMGWDGTSSLGEDWV